MVNADEDFLGQVSEGISQDPHFTKRVAHMKQQVEQTKDSEQGVQLTYHSYRWDPDRNLLYMMMEVLIDGIGEELLFTKCYPPKENLKDSMPNPIYLVLALTSHSWVTAEYLLSSNTRHVLEYGHDRHAHGGFHRTYDRLRSAIYLPKLRNRIQEYIEGCPTCQLSKPSRLLPYGQSQPDGTIARNRKGLYRGPPYVERW